MSYDKNRLVQDGESIKKDNPIDTSSLTAGELVFGEGYGSIAHPIMLTKTGHVKTFDQSQVQLLQEILIELKELNMLIREIVE